MLKKIASNILYPIVLLASTLKRKTCESLGIEANETGDKINKALEYMTLEIRDFIKAAQKILKKKRRYLILDDTLIDKLYARYIEGISDNYSSGKGRRVRSLCASVCMLSDGVDAIPITFELWISQEFSPDKYLTKTEVAQKVIESVLQHAAIDVVVMDGLYSNVNMILWLNEKNIPFEMRMHANRVININGESHKIKGYPKFDLMNGYQTNRTVKGSWHGIDLYFTAVRREDKNGKRTIVFQVSNYVASAKEHKKIYDLRWNIEKFFRTSKQYLGLNDCQSPKIEKQKKHIFSVFVAYIIALHERKKRKLKNVEEAIKFIRRQNCDRKSYIFDTFKEIFQTA